MPRGETADKGCVWCIVHPWRQIFLRLLPCLALFAAWNMTFAGAQPSSSAPKPPPAATPAPAATKPPSVTDPPALAGSSLKRQASAETATRSPAAERGEAAQNTLAEEPAEPHPAAADAEAAESGDDGEAEEEEPPISKPARAGGGLAHQMSSVERQLGRGRRQNGFFLSSWFTDAPSVTGFAPSSAISVAAPEDCEPLDAAIAEAYIRDSSRREGVNADLIREVVRKESGFNPCAVSPKGAMGMMQLTAATAASLGVGDPYDPRQNIDGGVRLMKRLLEKYKGRPDLALAAYNAGEAPVDALQRVPDYQETREYVTTIMRRVFEEPLRPAAATSRSPARIQPVAPIQPPISPGAGN